jgi:hypothetical protein
MLCRQGEHMAGSSSAASSTAPSEGATARGAAETAIGSGSSGGGGGGGAREMLIGVLILLASASFTFRTLEVMRVLMVCGAKGTPFVQVIFSPSAHAICPCTTVCDALSHLAAL